MEKKLLKLFDYQRFERSELLEKIIDEAENNAAHPLDENDLAAVSAALRESRTDIETLISTIQTSFPDVPSSEREKICDTLRTVGVRAAISSIEMKAPQSESCKALLELLRETM